MSYNRQQGASGNSWGYGTYYHHTTREAAQGIQETGRIYPSTDTHTDAMAGQGTYVTRMGPNNHPVRVARNNYDGNWEPNMGKTDVAIQMSLPKNSLTKVPQPGPGGRSIYVRRGDIDLNQAQDVQFHYRKQDGSYSSHDYY